MNDWLNIKHVCMITFSIFATLLPRNLGIIVLSRVISKYSIVENCSIQTGQILAKSRINLIISQIWRKELTPIFFKIIYMVSDYKLEPLWVPHPHLMSQEGPPKSRRIPEKYPVFGHY